MRVGIKAVKITFGQGKISLLVIMSTWFAKFSLLFSTGWIQAETDLPTTNLFNLLKYHVCMRSGVSKEMLQFLGDNASDSIEAANLKRLATNRREYNMWKTDHLGIVDLFQKFPSIMVDASGFVYRLKPIKPR